MPKSQIVEPTKERQAGSIPFAEVPLNQYQNDLDLDFEDIKFHKANTEKLLKSIKQRYQEIKEELMIHFYGK